MDDATDPTPDTDPAGDTSDSVPVLVDRFEGELPTLLGHLYRGEVDRTNSWRDRLDRTTNWAVTIIAALLTFVFSGTDNPHYLLLIGMVTVALFHVVETRRYLMYDVWRARVRLLEEDVFAPTVDPSAGPEHADWRRELGTDLRRPAVKTPFAEAYARRLRRVYLPLLFVLLVAWVARVTVFAPGTDPLAAAAVVDVPGTLVVAVVALGYAAAIAVAYWPRERRAKGELYDRENAGDWKEED